MADPLAEESQKYCVGGLVPYNETRAQYYLVEVIGKKERIPLKFGLTDGAVEVEMCMRARYGAAYSSDFGTLLQTQLAPSEEDNEIWGPWRSEYAVITAVRENLSKLPMQSAQERIMEWNSGSSTPVPTPSPPSLRGGPLFFPPEDDFEQRVNNANSSYVPFNLPAGPQRIMNPSQRSSPSNEVTPWEEDVSTTLDSPSTNSPISNIFSRSSGGGKQRLVDLTPGLKIPATPARETSEFFDRLNNLDPIKFSPPDSGQRPKVNTMPDINPVTYGNFANLNPCYDERYTQIEDFYDADLPDQGIKGQIKKYGAKSPGLSYSRSENLHNAQVSREDAHDCTMEHEEKTQGRPHSQSGDTHKAKVSWEDSFNHGSNYGYKVPVLSISQSRDFRTAQHHEEDTLDHSKKYGHKSPGMSHSQSESHIDFRATARDDHSIKVGKKFAIRGDQNRSSDDSAATASSTHSRGRTLNRTPSPVKHLDDINEDRTPPPKRSRSPMKQLFGPHGWLGKSMSMKELPSEKGGLKQFGGKLKQRIEHLTEDVSKFVPTNVYHSRSPSKSPPKSKFAVSLSPPLQAKLYSEMELMLCATANQYLNVQKDEGRISVESITKVTQYWASKNRPQVIEFMFDQATQRDLVLYNLKAFRFYGPHAENTLSMNSMMQSWRNLSREMSVRTFCTPDSVIKKQMHDTYKILEMLGAPLVTFLAFQEVQVKALKIIEDEQAKKKERENIKFGVERRWNPPTKTDKELKELENPFA